MICCRSALRGAHDVVGVAWATSNLTAPGHVPTVEWGPSPASLPFSALSAPSSQYLSWGILSPLLHFAKITPCTS
jgi:hypothetical protein